MPDLACVTIVCRDNETTHCINSGATVLQNIDQNYINWPIKRNAERTNSKERGWKNKEIWKKEKII